MLTCKILELKGQIPEVKWNALWEDYRKFVEKKNKKINQLETNRDEAIEYIKHSWWLRTDQVYDTSKDLKGWEVEGLLEILERGKE